MIRAVADTNVYVSALHFGGLADEVLSLARRGEIALFISPQILDEIQGVLIAKFRWSTSKVREAIGSIEESALLVHPAERIAEIEEDEPDNRVLECAVEAEAGFIISGDKQHLQRLREYRGIRILGPGEFLESL
jgi:putative PIN family toxin of toxin-antitoxin system